MKVGDADPNATRATGFTNGRRHYELRLRTDSAGSNLRRDHAEPEGPWRGTKPTEGQGASRPATVVRALRTRQRRKASKSALRPAERRDLEPATEPGDDAEQERRNGKGATATAMWNGCRRGEFFEGCETRRGKCPAAPRSTALRAARPRKVDGRKHGEPHDWQRDATSPRPPGGGNHRGGAKPRGWNGIAERDSPRPKQAETSAGVDARQGRWRGETESDDEPTVKTTDSTPPSATEARGGGR
jgi:hypothetical protein